MRPIAASLCAALAATVWAGIAFADDSDFQPTHQAFAFSIGELELDTSYEQRVKEGLDASLASGSLELAPPSTMDCTGPRRENPETCVVSIADVRTSPGPAALPAH